jgi:hypothetical protein
VQADSASAALLAASSCTCFILHHIHPHLFYISVLLPNGALKKN